MNAHVGRSSAISLGARSLLAFVLEPKAPLKDWYAALDEWLARTPNFFSAKPVILQMGGLTISLKEYRTLLSQLALRHIRVMAVENTSRALVGPHLSKGGQPLVRHLRAPGRSEPARGRFGEVVAHLELQFALRGH